MNPEDRELLKRVAKLSEENNAMLHKIRSTARWAVVWGFVKVLIFIVIPVVLAVHYLTPYLGTLQKTLSQAQGALNKLNY